MSSDGFVKGQSDNLPVVHVLMIADFFSKSDFFNAAETRGVKAQRSQRDNYGDAAVGYVEVKREKDLCTVRARICPEHRVRSKPYSVEAKVDERKEEILNVSCNDCAASAGGCKHAVAFLMWLHRRSEEPEPTATVCYWKKATLSQVGTNLKFIRTTDMKKPEKCYDCLNTDNFVKNVVDELRKRNCYTQLSPHLFTVKSHKDYSLHQIVIKFVKTGQSSADDFILFAKSQMDIEGCIDISKTTEKQSESKLWFELRYCRITASKFYEIAHCKTQNGTLVEQIIGASKLINNEAMERGRRLEKEVIRELEKKWSIKLNNCGLLLNPQYPIIGASPDAVGPDFVVEIKCPVSEKTELKYIAKNGKIATRYLAQIQLQMFFKNVKKGYFCVAKPDFEISKNITVVPVQYDQLFVKNMIEKAMTFWKANIFHRLYNTVK